MLHRARHALYVMDVMQYSRCMAYLVGVGGIQAFQHHHVALHLLWVQHGPPLLVALHQPTGGLQVQELRASELGAQNKTCQASKASMTM